MKPLVKPQININGTSREALVEQQCGVLHALDALTKAMNEAAPNGRDYQLRPEEFRPARQAWTERILVLDALYREIEAHALALQDR